MAPLCGSVMEACSVRLMVFMAGGAEVRTGPEIDALWIRGVWECIKVLSFFGLRI